MDTYKENIFILYYYFIISITLITIVIWKLSIIHIYELTIHFFNPQIL